MFPLRTLPIILAIAALVILPLVMQPRESGVTDESRQVIILTPHNEQIRTEVAPAFDKWHREHYGEPVRVIYNVPGGTSEIRKMLMSEFQAALESGLPPGGSNDLIFGGGSYEHGLLKSGVLVTVNGEERRVPISVPVDFDAAFLAEVYRDNLVGTQVLYDPDRYWFGTVLSGFGIVYNRDLLEQLDTPEPRRWDALADPHLQGWIALVNPGQSGSVTTVFETILQRTGWHEGWRILRRAAANARYFSAVSLKPPIDVGNGEAAMGVCIDFFGRFQSQALKSAGGGDRVGYLDPPGATMIDPDPISMLDGAPNPETAKRFIEFLLTEEGQALWQFRLDDNLDDGGDDGPGSGWGPQHFELRRMPIRRSLYEKHFDRFVDQVDPYEIAKTNSGGHHPAIRAFVAPLFSSMAMDHHDLLRDVWWLIVNHPAYPGGRGIVTAADVDDPQLKEMLAVFDSLPGVSTPDGGALTLEDIDQLGDIKRGWLRDGWREDGLWSEHDTGVVSARRDWGRFFKNSYERIITLAEQK